MVNDILRSGIQVGWGKQWETLANAINDWYGGGVSSAQYKQVTQMLNSGEYTMEQMESILQQIPDFSTTYNAEGKLTSVSYQAVNAGNTTAGSIANAVDSNAANATTTQFKTVQNITKDTQTGKVTISDNVKAYNGGVASTAKAVAGSTISALCATSVGISVGKTFDSILYNLNPDFWDEHNMGSLNPETWSSITAGDNSAGAKLFNWVFKIDPNNGNPQAYIDQNAFAYMVAYMASQGAFNSGGAKTTYDETVRNVLSYPNFYPNPLYTNGDITVRVREGYDNARTVVYNPNTPLAYNFKYNNTDIQPLAISENSFTSTAIFNYDDQHTETYNYPAINSILGSPLKTRISQTPFYISNSSALSAVNRIIAGDTINVTSRPVNENYYKDLATIIIDGNTEIITPIDGITPQAGVTQFDASGISDPSDIAAVLAALMSQFPDLWDNRIEVSPDGDNIITYIPVGFPTGGVGSQPTTEGATATDLAPDISGDGQNATDELIKTLIDLIQNPQDQNGMESDTDTPTEPIDPNMPNTGGGTTPPFVIPTGSASALYSVYNPSQTQLNSLGAWLWSSNFVDQLLKLFNDPMQAIIGLHKIFATPPTSGTGNIKVGYLDSGVGANLVSAQYTEIDCGTVKIDEYFKNALDYVKTDIYLYLPFIGIVPLSVEDVTRANINVKYKVDVLTGACLATVNVTRDANGGGQLYAYAGNCAVQYPLSSGSYMGIVASALGIAGSVAGTILSGGAMLPMALGVGASALGGARTRVEHSGSLSGNSGAMGIKKPYLIIRRPQTKIADNFEFMAGANNNIYDVLSGFSGLTRVKYVHLENIPATSDELAEIETLLKSGVMI